MGLVLQPRKKQRPLRYLQPGKQSVRGAGAVSRWMRHARPWSLLHTGCVTHCVSVPVNGLYKRRLT